MRNSLGRWKLLLYGCSGLGVNMLNLIVGSYLCSALLVGGFDKNAESWTYLNRDLVIAGLWAGMVFVAKIIDGLIDLPFSHLSDNFRTKWGKRKPAIILGCIPMIVSYLLFLIPINNSATILNTIWFAGLLFVFYGCYTFTMITYYATFAEVTQNNEEIVFLSNVKSVCDVVFFVLGFALLPVFVSMQINIRIVALIFLPLVFTMVIPLLLLKEDVCMEEYDDRGTQKSRTTLLQSISFTFKDRPFIQWLFVLFIMNIGLQLFLGGINEYFSNVGLDMTTIMACCFVPVPLTIWLYNKVVNRYGLGFAYRYILIAFSVGMGLMWFCKLLPTQIMLPYAIVCSLIASLSIGAFFSVTYTVPSQRAAARMNETESASSMYFAIQGLFEGGATGFATGIVLVFLKQNGLVPYMTLFVSLFCLIACVMTLFLPKAITGIGKKR